METNKLPLSKSDRALLRKEISDSDDSEILSAVTVSDTEFWSSLRILSRGTTDAAPAILRGLRPGDILLHNHPNGQLEPSDADLHIASICGKSGIGFAIHDNSCKEMYVVVEPFEPEDIQTIDPETASNILRKNGPIAKHIPDYQERTGQINLLNKVVEAFNEPCHAILEGGTGIGKSMAYLTPAILYSMANKCRVAVSTNTINLQYQLFNKDLPLLKKSLKKDFRFALIKGRGNYLCIRRLNDIASQNEGETLLDHDEFDEFVKLIDWSSKTKDGSLSDLSWVPGDSLWEKVNSDKDVCIGLKCPEYKSCFFYRARRESAEADILVVNHYLLFSDLALRSSMDEYSQTAVIPAYTAVILDEAHNTEEIATSHFGSRATFFGILKLLGRLYHKRGKREYGVLPSLIVQMGKSINLSIKAIQDKIISEIRESFIPLKDETTDILRDFFDDVIAFTLAGKDRRSGEEKFRITSNHRTRDDFKSISKKATCLTDKLKSLKRKVTSVQKKFEDILEDSDESGRRGLEGNLLEMGAFSRRANEVIDSLDLFFSDGCENRDEFVHFFSVSIRKDNKWPAFHSAPIDVSKEMVKCLFNKIPTVVLVSATLSTKNCFDFIRSRVGLNSPDLESEVIEGNFGSPFNYMEQACLLIPDDLPEPSNPSFVESTREPVFKIIKSSMGGTLVLCTSYTHLKYLYDSLRDRVTELGITCLKQGDFERHFLLEKFKDDGNAVLFATDSFWEGVDIPGSSLRNLVLAKLPFVIPDDPILVARQEKLEKQGKNSFSEYQLPMAAIKLKQGFGRLIRKMEDRGTIWILDKRIITKLYGKYLIDSLPKTRIVRGPFSEIISHGNKFFLNPAPGQ
ncbi:MAG: hypothetical protein HQM10_03505 [Candidatus Riflebacteria bacterium]|nr:hypothetical protein [Candidatus Riflebacteria bacterium]